MTSPRLKAVILRVFRVVPEPGKHGIRRRRQRQDPGSLIREVLAEPFLQSLEDILPDAQVPLRRRQAQGVQMRRYQTA
jgi:hypothetical protein